MFGLTIWIIQSLNLNYLTIHQKQHCSSNTQKPASQPLEYLIQQNPPYQNANLLPSQNKNYAQNRQHSFMSNHNL